jgi:hypothetical protein
MHLVHAAAFASAAAAGDAEALRDGAAWARATLADSSIEHDSRDERLWRRSTEAEVIAVLDAFWQPGVRSAAARHALRAWLANVKLDESDASPFDEAVEEDIHPLLVDCGWELLPLASLDPERHRGAMDWFGTALDFEIARFEEENAMPPPTHLQELSALGTAELLRGVDDEGALAAPFVVWTSGNDRYHEYVLAGVQRAAKL